MWKGMRGKWAAVFLIISWVHVVAALSSSAGGSSPSQYSRRINLRSKSPANLHLQTLRSSRQTPDLPALYSAPKERAAPKEEAQAPPPAAVYGPPADLNDDSSVATTEMATEENLEGASTSAPSESADEDGGEVVESEVTERTEYLPPPSTPTKRRRLKDQKMVESNPIHQIQIHVVPPHLSQGDHNGEILGTSYGVPEMMMMSHPEYIRGQYLPPQQGQQVDVAAKQEEQKGSSYGGPQAREDGSDSRQQQQLPSTEYETPRRDEPAITGQPQKSSSPQIYHVPTTYQSPSTNQLGYSTRSRNKPQAQQYRQQDAPNQQQQQNNYATHQTQYNNQFPSTQGYQTQTQQQGQQQSFSRNQPASYQGAYPQQSQNGKQTQQGYQQGNQMLKDYPSNFNPNQDYQANSGIDQGGYPQRSYQDSYSPTPAAQQQYSLNQVTNEEEQQDDAVVIQGFPSSQQNQPDQQFQQDYQTFNHNYAPQTPTKLEPQEALTQTQSPAEYGPPQSFFEPQTYSLPTSTSSFSGGYPQQQQAQPHYQPQPQIYDQQPLTSNSNLRQPQQHQVPPSQPTFQNTPGSQYDSQGYPESRSQTQRNNPSSHPQPIPPSTQPQQTVTNPQSQYLQGNFFSQPAQPQFRSNSLDFESQNQDEELEGLNGRIVDEALLARVQQIIEEHERQQKSLLANFKSNSPPSSPSSSEYSSGAPFTPQQQQQQQGGSQPSPIAESYKLSQPQGGLEEGRAEEGYGSYNPGIQYQKAILSQQFTETSPIPTTQQQQDSYAPPPQQFAKGQAEEVGRSKSDGLRLVPAPQLGRSQDQVREDDIPKPVYGVPLAPVIGLDSNENFKVVDEPQQNSLSSVSNNYLPPTPQQIYGRNRRRVTGRVIKLNNASPRISIPYVE